MSDALDESVNSLDDDLAAEWAEMEGREPAVEVDEVNTPDDEVNTEKTTEDVVAEESEEQPDEQPEEEERLTPYDHWRADYKEGFSSMDRKQQELWLQREKEFDEGIRAKGQELSQAKNFIGELHSIVSPMVNDWQRQGLQPDAGIRRAIALEQALRDNPQQTLVQLAQERGVDLQQTWAEQPYKDPAVSQLETQLREQREQMEQWRTQQETAQREQQAQQQQIAFQQVMDMKNATDEAGNLQYPHLEYVMGNMAQAMESGRARSLETAYTQAVQELRNHPVIKDSIAKTTQQTTQQRQAEASKARAASKAVDSNSTGTSNQPKTIDQDILDALEASGL